MGNDFGAAFLAKQALEAPRAPRAWQPTNPIGEGWMSRDSRAMPVPMSKDLARVLELPFRPEIDHRSAEAEALIEMMTRRYALPPAPCRCRQISEEHQRIPKPCITRFRLAQAWGLFELGVAGGMLGVIGVGHGKTLMDVLAPLAVRGCKTAVLLVPPKLVKQLRCDYQLIAQHFRVPEIVVHGKPFHVPVAGAPVLHVLPYSLIQTKGYTDWFERVRPDTVIADECHRLKNNDTATTSRVMRYFAAHRETRLAAWSGSISTKSITEYAHLAALALGVNSPLPLDPDVVDDWARAMHFDEDQRCAPGALEQLLEEGETDIYHGFRRRLARTEGVVTTREAAVDADLRIVQRIAPPIPNERVLDPRSDGIRALGVPPGQWPGLIEAMDYVRATWVRPDGEQMLDMLTTARCLRELACGFFYRWKFIRGEPDELIEEWRTARREWHAELRQKLKSRIEHLDSPDLCKNAAERYWGDRPANKGLPVWHSHTWPRWRDVRGKVSPISEAIWISDYLARDAAAWALEHRGIVWYASSAFGRRVGALSGLKVHGGGPKAPEEIAKERGEASIIVSIPSHGTGTDGLQYVFHDQLLAQPGPDGWEQVLGRLHRVGQTAPVVTAEFYKHTEELANNVDQALARATYVQGTFGADQKILAGMEDEE